MNILCVPVGPLQANCYLVSDDSGTAVAIDPGGEADRLSEIAEERGLRITHILLTHGHFDHLAGAADLAKLVGASVGCSAATAPMLRDPDKYIPFPGFEGVPGKEPDSLLAEGDILDIGELNVEVVETPGHSAGDITLAVSGHLFCGDLLFRRSVGRTDLPGGDFETLVRSVQKLLDRFPGETPVYPGHMDATTLGEEAIGNPFLDGRVSIG